MSATGGIVMALLQNVNLGLSFLLELIAVASFAYWGFNATDSTVLKFVLGLGAAILTIVVWGIFAAPKSERRLKGSALLIFKAAFFALAALALVAAGSGTLGLIVAIACAINLVLIEVWHQENAAVRD